MERAPLRFRYHLVGTEIVRNVGDDFTGRYLETFVRLSHRDVMTSELARVVELAAPVTSIWEYTREDGRHVRYERLVLPLKGDGATVDMFLCGIAFDKDYA